MNLQTVSEKPPDEYSEKQKHHVKKVDEILSRYFLKKKTGTLHPVIDFLFSYYSFRPLKLRTWSPGIFDSCGLISGESLPEALKNFVTIDEEKSVFRVDAKSFPKKRTEGLKQVKKILEATEKNPPSFGCFGLHEWAMVYGSKTKRHKKTPLRLTEQEISKLMEVECLRCTHYDALRFFTETARPLNKHHPTRETVTDFEQSACVHANMDIYKWAYKIFPWINGDLLWETFLLAYDGRMLDMRAGPYDLSGYGIEPICIETGQGRKSYVAAQKKIRERGLLLRKRVKAFYDELIQANSDKN